jgi:hypothetical protein
VSNTALLVWPILLIGLLIYPPSRRLAFGILGFLWSVVVLSWLLDSRD